MANKRDLKKQIRYVCGELALACIFTRDCIEDTDRTVMNGLLVKIAELQSHALQHLDFSYDKMPSDFSNRAEYNKSCHAYKRLAYQSFRKEFNNKLAEIVKEMNGQLTPQQKELNKQAMNQK